MNLSSTENATDARKIDGKAFAAQLRATLSGEVDAFKKQYNVTPGLAVILVGSDSASQIYVRNKIRQTKEVGMQSSHYELPATATEEEVLSLIDQLNNDSAVHGILVQLPLPAHIDEQKVIEAVSVKKDVDGFHPENTGRLSIGLPCLTSCTPLGCLMLLKSEVGDLSGKNALVIGRSNMVGKPMAALLLNESCTVTIAHSKTKNLAEQCRQADILVAAVGRPEMVKGDWIKPGAVVIDVGINRVETEEGKTALVGDVEFSAASKVAAAITPVPGGVGPMTIACLLHNTLQAARMSVGLKT